MKAVAFLLLALVAVSASAQPTPGRCSWSHPGYSMLRRGVGFSVHLFQGDKVSSQRMRWQQIDLSFPTCVLRAASHTFLSCCCASAQPLLFSTHNHKTVCRVLKSFNAVANTGMVQDTLNMPDAFPVGNIKVSNLVLGHPDVASLQMTLLHRATPDAAFTSAPLTPAKDLAGAYAPDSVANVIGQSASNGQWVLRVVDAQPGAEQ